MADATEYKVRLVQSEGIPAPDDLIAGTDQKTGSIKLTAEGEYERGLLLMSGEDGYVKATAEGTASKEVCILTDTVTVPSGSYIESAGYFKGTFNAKAVILDYEGEEDDHEALIEGIRVNLRKQGIFVV